MKPTVFVSLVHSGSMLILVILTLSGVGCRQSPVVDPEIVAHVGSAEIRVSDVQAELARRASRGAVTVEATEVLDDLINKEALYAAALSKGLDRDPAVQRAWKNLLIGTLKERELQPRVQAAAVSEQAVKDHYQQNLARYAKPAQVRLGILMVRTHPKMSAEKRKALADQMAEARIRALEASSEVRDFGSLAIDYSEDQTTRYKGGDIGWLDVDANKNHLDPEVLAAANALPQKGAVSEVIEAKNGLYLVKLIDRREAEVSSLAQIEPTARHRLLLQERERIEQAFIEEARLAAPVVVNSNQLGRLSVQFAQKDSSVPRSQLSVSPEIVH